MVCNLWLRRSSCAVIVAAATLGSTVGSQFTAAADPDQVDSLIAQMEKVSREVEAKNEEVKHLEEELTGKEKSIDSLRQEVKASGECAERARSLVDSTQTEVNRLAASKYRGAAVDPITTVISAKNPQSAIDRSAYLASRTKRTESTVEGLLHATEEAAAEHNRASRAAAQADFELGEMQSHKKDLDRQQEDLKKQTEGIRKQVDGLSDADRQRWIQKNGPLEVDMARITGINPAGMAAVQAAMTKLGAPYGWGATGPSEFDCSGLVYWAFQQQGKTVPRTSQAQMGGGTPVSRAELQPGDVVGYYPGATHVGIYVGDGKLVHASDYGIPVQVVGVDSMPFYGARRY
ncbi:putative endopeptidase precursor [Corynebacterium durum]|nr:NlpC/P60 family protein [Corynebacterium durum]WJY85563.1 putative endopeptidase precursor [Corynebacterium durum]